MCFGCFMIWNRWRRPEETTLPLCHLFDYSQTAKKQQQQQQQQQKEK